MTMTRAASVFIAAAVVCATMSGGADAMAVYKWRKRPLLVFAGAAGDASLEKQRAIVAANRGGFAERDMVVVYVVGSDVSSDLGPGPGMSAAALRSRYGVAAGAFRAVLVGKDGGAKISSASPLPAGTLFGTIDAMPMRQQEMRRK